MFFQVDDQLPVNAKVRKLIDGAMTGDLKGVAAMGLWTLAGASNQASLTDGVLTNADLVRILLNPTLALELAEYLVSVQLWHGRGHSCPRCPQPDEGPYAGDWIFHDWFALGYSTAEQTKTQRAKAKELKDPALINAVWARDCTDPQQPGTGRCRYCGETVHRKTTVGDKKPEMDHVDPTVAIGPRNVVLACNTCNRKKGRRTPEQAGMTLQPPPARPDASTTAVTTGGTSRGRPPVDHGPELSRARGAGDAGARAPGRVRAGLVEGHQQGPPDAVAAEVTRAPGETSQPSKSARRRSRRHRGTSADPESTTAGPSGLSPRSPELDAGVADPVPTAGRFGSPWHGWTGPRSSVTETTCSVHLLEQPCPNCPGGDA